MIKTDELSKDFQTPAGALNVLKDINLEINEGEFVAIVGASGAGKSTLLHILGTLDRPTTGTLTMEGRDVASMNEKELTVFRNTKVGFVFQFHHLMPEFNALENAMMPLLIKGIHKNEAAEKARGLLTELGLANRVTHRPGELSGGEQQRVAMARALIMDPKVVLADEPTGNLDTHTGDDLFTLLHKINKDRGTTFVMVTHNPSLSTQCDRVIEMRDGSIVS
ncbi:ABC transporter ATP-binding protein [Nitrospirota bacterium]